VVGRKHVSPAKTRPSACLVSQGALGHQCAYKYQVGRSLSSPLLSSFLFPPFSLFPFHPPNIVFSSRRFVPSPIDRFPSFSNVDPASAAIPLSDPQLPSDRGCLAEMSANRRRRAFQRVVDQREANPPRSESMRCRRTAMIDLANLRPKKGFPSESTWLSIVSEDLTVANICF
jgi:hypothetical protein